MNSDIQGGSSGFVVTLLATPTMALFAKIIEQIDDDFIVFALALIVKLH